MSKWAEAESQIIQSQQWIIKELLSLDITTAEQHTTRETALKNIAEWLKIDIHNLRKTFEG